MGGFWSVLASMADGSISRVWYSGHAAPDHLFLSLGHSEEACTANSNDYITTAEIILHSHLASKFKTSTPTMSEFYGCYTKNFAQKWNNVFGVPTAGAINPA